LKDQKADFALELDDMSDKKSNISSEWGEKP